MGHQEYKKSSADPCVYFKWKNKKLQVCASWVDDLLSAGQEKYIIEDRNGLKKHFELDELGKLKEYVGAKVDYNNKEGWIKLTQPVLIQSFEDEFELPNASYKTAGTPGITLRKSEVTLNAEEHRQYQKGVGKLIHLAENSRPDILNPVRELSRHGGEPSPAHMTEMLRVMKYCVDTKTWGLLLWPHGKWDGSNGHEFGITGRSDAAYASCKETMTSVSGWSCEIDGAAYVRKSKTQRFVTLSVTEAECVAAVSCVQDMIYGKNFLESLGLKVKMPMDLYMDNKGGVDIFNGWSISGNTRAVSIRFAYIRELKEQGILKIHWLSGEMLAADLFTKNLDSATAEKHASFYCD